MIYRKTAIESIGYLLPDREVTSSDIETRLSPVYERLRLPFGRLEMMSGIRARRWWPADTLSSEVAVQAAERALAASNIPLEDIGVLIHASVCRDFIEPATATVVHHALGLPFEAPAFDLSNACLGVVNGIVEVANRIELGQIRAGLIVSGENGAPLVEHTIDTLLTDETLTRKSIKDSFASLTIGSGAVAVVVADRAATGGRRRLLGGAERADTSANELCRGDAESGSASTGRPLMRTGSEELMKRGCALAGRTWEALKAEVGWTNECVDRLVCHQVGSAHQRLLCETLGVDREKDFTTFADLGNMGSASLPVTLARADETGALGEGDRVALMGIGSGLNCVMLAVEW